MRKEKIFILLIITLLNFRCSAQNVKPIIQGKRYTHEIASKNDNYYFFGGYYIDPQKKNTIDLKSLEQGINKKIQDINYSGYVVLDIENKVYQELKSNSKSHVNYKKNIKCFIDMVILVKTLRPNAKVVVYNVPFKFNSEKQKKYNDFDKLYPLLKVVDAFTPSLYLHYSDKERKDIFFDNYVKTNLDLNFEYAEKLNKKVIPFVWYKIHPSNKDYGGTVINKTQYSDYLNLINDYRYKGKKIEKIIYWEPAKENIDINMKLIETINILKNHN
ncbi:hypothetical protein OBJ96_03195 [Empedobacter falsenii]